MTHNYAVRMPLDRQGAVPPVAPAHLTRMEDQGWSVMQPVPGVDAVLSGIVGCHETADWFAIGLVFLQDRAGVAAQLGLSVEQADAKSDIELLFDLRIAHGIDFVRDVTGTFSLVFINRQTGAFEAFRDHFGVYPFYYTVQDGALTCASDLRACLHLSGAALAADRLRIADYIQGSDVDLDRTAFEGVYRLPPAHLFVPGTNEVMAERYWQLETPELYAGEDGPAALRVALSKATAASVRPERAVGAMLSGGLDSSSLAGLAAEASPTPLRTLSFVYGPDKPYDETPYIDAANQTFGTEPHKIPVVAGVVLDEIGPVIEEQVDLFLAPGLQKSRQIFAEAQSLGLDTLIDGHGGDEAISHGYSRLVELAAGRRYWRLLREARGAALVHGVPPFSLVMGHLARFGGLRPRHPVRRVLMKIARLTSGGLLNAPGSSTTVDLIAADLRENVDMDARYASDQPLKTTADFHRAEQIMHMRSVSDPLIVQSFEVLHRAATAAGIQPRYPFFDQRVISLCLSLPSDQKLRDGRSRWALREAMRGVLPEKIRQRVDKAAFDSEVDDAVIAFYQPQDSARFAPVAAFVDVEAAERLRSAVISGQESHTDAIRALWRLAVLIHWAAAFERWQDAQSKGTLI